MLFCVKCVIVLYLHCSTLPPGIDPFAVNDDDNNNTNNNSLHVTEMHKWGV
jgi:hypothetical protein